MRESNKLCSKKMKIEQETKKFQDSTKFHFHIVNITEVESKEGFDLQYRNVNLIEKLVVMSSSLIIIFWVVLLSSTK